MTPTTGIAPASGKLGILIPGLGAVSTTFIAGVEAVRHGLAKPIGSLTQMGTVRLGKRTDKRSPLIKEFLPLAGLDQLVFGGWDIYNDNCFQAASNARVLDKDLLAQVQPLLSSIQPMPAVFDKNYVKRLDGPNVKKAASKWDLAQALRDDIRKFKAANGCDRLVMIWCGSTEAFRAPGAVHATIEAFEAGLKASHPDIAPSMIYA
ncbi:MAG TPA: inositol-3-phosphate synthase, partial [Terriglobales bacterium]|nr:inositol-3-phosphate synthase [Terriglobales bacterium]